MFCTNLNVYPLSPFSSFLTPRLLQYCYMAIWGLTTMPSIENVQMYACKRFLNVSKMSRNDAFFWDLGRYLIYVFAAKRCIKYWLPLTKMPYTRYARLCYYMLVCYDRSCCHNWATDFRVNLYSNGYGYVWEAQYVAFVSYAVYAMY